MNFCFSLLKKNLILFLSMFALSLHTAPSKKTWTFLVYMAADNQLAQEAEVSIEQMKKIGSSENVHVLVYLNSKDSNQRKITQRLYINKDSAEEVGSTQAQDSGSEATLFDALQWAFTDFSSDYFALCIWDHASQLKERQMGSLADVCYDATTGNFLTDTKYRYALKKAIHQFRSDKKINILLFDSCLMADLAVAFALEPCVEYLISSQDVRPSTALDYSELLNAFNRNSLGPQILTQAFIGGYMKQYGNAQEPYIFSALNLMHISAIANSLDLICESLQQLLFSDIVKPVRHGIIKSGMYTLHFGKTSAIDLFSFGDNLDTALRRLIFTYKLDNPLLNTVRALVEDLMRSTGNAVCGLARSKEHYGSRGISIYFPNLESGIIPSCYNLCWSKEHPQWLELMRTLIQTENIELDVLENSFYARKK